MRRDRLGRVGGPKTAEERVRPMHNKLIWTFLLIPLIIVMATKNPQLAGDVITLGAKLLDAVANLLSHVVSALSAKHH